MSVMAMVLVMKLPIYRQLLNVFEMHHLLAHSPTTSMSNAEVLQEELEVLESIFPDELESE
jgi:hypothetical protein